MNDYQIRFLKQSVLGQTVRMNISKEVIKRCIVLADRDMLSGGRFICNFFKIKTSKERVDYFFRVLERADYVYEKIDKEAVCDSIFWECDETRHPFVQGKKRTYKPYGLAQKLVNMTFKYLYVYKDHIEKDIDFSTCDCPIDSVVLGRIESKENWTNLTKEEYDRIQSIISEKLQEERYGSLKGEIGRMAFDDTWAD